MSTGQETEPSQIPGGWPEGLCPDTGNRGRVETTATNAAIELAQGDGIALGSPTNHKRFALEALCLYPSIHAIGRSRLFSTVIDVASRF